MLTGRADREGSTALKAKKHFSKKTVLPLLLLLAAVTALLITCVRLSDAEREKERLQTELQQLQQENENLSETINRAEKTEN